MARILFVSDLHQFSRRSQTDRYQEQLFRRATDADIVILGGDIFDFRWSTIGDFKSSVQRATRWLGDLAERNPSSEIHYVLGNHDCQPEFVEALNQASFGRDIHVHPHFLRLGDTFFTHGDVVDGSPTHERFMDRRRDWQRDTHQKPSYRHTLYDVVISCRLHKLVAGTVHNARFVTTRLLAYMSDIDQTREQGVRRVVFGHTHQAIQGWKREGIEFYNCGAPIAGLQFELLELEVDI